jgi:GNAT superfamily N-acetyltransferase
MRTALLNLDRQNHVALVAEVRASGDRVPVGIARLARAGPCEAELAVAVVDSWQGRGIGKRLLAELGEVGRDLGYTRLHGFVLPENRRVIRLLQQVFPGAVRRWDDGVVRVDCPLGIPEIADEDLLAALLG